MKRALVLVCVLALLLAGGLAAAGGRRAPARVYTVAQVRAGLARQRAAWIGRTVLVRGVAILAFWPLGSAGGVSQPCALPPSVQPAARPGPQPCPLVAPPTAPPGTTGYLRIVDDAARSDPRHPFYLLPPSNPLTLDLAVPPVAPNPLIAVARRLPLLARVLPAPGEVPGGVPSLYRVRVRPARAAPCTSPLWSTCADGVLVAAQP